MSHIDMIKILRLQHQSVIDLKSAIEMLLIDDLFAYYGRTILLITLANNYHCGQKYSFALQCFLYLY